MTADNEIELDLLVARLRAAGIRCMHSAGGPQSGLFGGRDILVEEDDLDHARELLEAEAGDFDEDELVRLSEEAGRRAHRDSPPLPPQASRPVQATRAVGSGELGVAGDGSTPEARQRLSRILARLTRRTARAGAPDNPFGR